MCVCFSQDGQLVGLMPVLAACHLIYVFSVVLHCISIHVVANKVLSLSLYLFIYVATKYTRSALAHLHNAVPVVARSNAKQREKRHAEVAEVSVVAQAFARMSVRTFYTCAHKFTPSTLTVSSTQHPRYCHPYNSITNA